MSWKHFITAFHIATAVTMISGCTATEKRHPFVKLPAYQVRLEDLTLRESPSYAVNGRIVNSARQLTLRVLELLLFMWDCPSTIEIGLSRSRLRVIAELEQKKALLPEKVHEQIDQMIELRRP